MEVAVFDTYVKKKQGGLMHFDILVPAGTGHDHVLHFGQQYLAAKGQDGQDITTRECRFCHVEEATAEVKHEVITKGFHIIELQGC